MKRFNLRLHHPVILGFSFLALLLSVANAAFASANVSVSYSSATYIPPNSLVSTVSGSPNMVELANLDNAARLVGVVVSNNQSLLSANTNNNTQVALSGVVDVSASTLNGDIHVGDQISPSSVDGVGMKAGTGVRPVGIAESELNSSSSDAAAIVVGGKTVYLGHVTLSIAAGNFSASQNQPALVNFLETLAAKVSGHQASETQAILSAVVALIAIVATFTLVYGTVRGGLISIGRNPLAKMLIVHSIEELMALIPAIVIIAVIAIYFILR
ncbi:MAG TPA: hypothetical protein VNG90_04650 [Candidatus Acidoferrum sp.]|nr:hypothetical protein [Candidatus Acidoferrum sp.]